MPSIQERKEGGGGERAPCERRKPDTRHPQDNRKTQPTQSTKLRTCQEKEHKQHRAAQLSWTSNEPAAYKHRSNSFGPHCDHAGCTARASALWLTRGSHVARGSPKAASRIKHREHTMMEGADTGCNTARRNGVRWHEGGCFFKGVLVRSRVCRHSEDTRHPRINASPSMPATSKSLEHVTQ